jgi:hypothetical protein
MPKIKFTPEEEAEAAAWFRSPGYEATKYHEIFTHVDHLEREIRHFNATDLYRDILAGKVNYSVFVVPFTGSDYLRIVNDNGVEEPRVDRLTYNICRRPILVAQFPQGEHVLIDGNHRVVRRFREGLNYCTAFFVEHPAWSKYLVTMPRLVERLKVEDTINAQTISHEERYGVKKAQYETYKTITS